jgi:acetyl esterase/lipase
VVVVDVEYRLVPEHAFPTGIEDSFAAVKHVYNNGKLFNVTQSISIGGVSAGANIALVCAHWARDANIPVCLVAAGTPTIDDLAQYATASDSPFKSMQENEFAPTLNWARLAWFDKLKWSSLSSDAGIQQKQRQRIGWVKNLFDAPNFANLPRTLIFTAGADPLRDEGEAYAMKLIEHGNDVVVKRFLGVPHPFMKMDGALVQGELFINMTCREIRMCHE